MSTLFAYLVEQRVEEARAKLPIDRFRSGLYDRIIEAGAKRGYKVIFDNREAGWEGSREYFDLVLESRFHDLYISMPDLETSLYKWKFVLKPSGEVNSSGTSLASLLRSLDIFN